MADKDELGKAGEELAAAYLRARGHAILDRNWRCKQGELDIVSRDGDVLAFVEVKTRTSVAFGLPVEAISRQKHRRLRTLAALWCEDHPLRHRGIRLDALGVLVVAPRGTTPSTLRQSDVSISYLPGGLTW